ncbi:restriction endonuclease subunit S [Candidatus Desantisbacteria bacterium]|nr:restriction endonuclease subunit S [Candidatus Desantisbacteria bacterium]
MQGGASYPAVTDKNIYSLLIARPQKEEQLGISKILSDIDQKIELAERKKQTLNNLFQSMLNKLMTGAIRI